MRFALHVDAAVRHSEEPGNGVVCLHCAGTLKITALKIYRDADASR